VGRYTLSVCEMSVGEGFMTRRAVALELICVARELFTYISVCFSRSQSSRCFRREVR
jgi:hypothetical protein